MKVDVKRICSAIVGGLILKAIIDKVEVETCVKPSNSYAVSYGTAVKVIMDSNMFDSAKQQAIRYLKHNQDQGYYEAVISIIESDMFDSAKVNTIKEISE